MTGFRLIDREYPRLPRLLEELAPGFTQSEEHARLAIEDFDLPTVVCGAFNRYLCRLQNRAATTPPDPGEVRELSDIYRALERLSQSPDAEVVNTVMVEVFEHLDLSPNAFEAFKSQLGAASRKLFDEVVNTWEGRGPT